MRWLLWWVEDLFQLALMIVLKQRLGGFDVFPFQRPKVYLRKEIISDSGPIVSSKSIRWKSYYFLRYPRVYTQDVLVHFLMTSVLWATIIYLPISSSIFCRQSCKIIYIIIQPVLFYWTPRQAVTANNERLDPCGFHTFPFCFID